MRIRRRTLRRLFPLSPFLFLFAAPALSQNLILNPRFDRDLSGWTPRILDGTSTQPNADTFVAWDSSDAAGSAASGGVGLRARALEWQGATAAVGQCVALPSPSLVSFGVRFLTRRERLSNVTTTAAFFASGDCTGTSMSTARAPAMPSSITTGSNSGGLWMPNGTQALSPPGAHSVFLEVGAKAEWTWYFGSGWLDVVADDAFLTLTPAATTSSLLPSAAWISGSGAYWSTRMTLVNPGAADAAVTLKWLGHDMDGRGGAERAYLVRAGQTMELLEEEWEISHQQNYGAILVTSSSPSLFLQSETSTSVSGGGTVGQALPAFGQADYAGATPKVLAPIRENESFRTNLVLANPTEIPVTAHVALFAADGSAIGSRDVDLPPLGMTQINRVAAALGAASLSAGRISVSTASPGGLVAAYASVIDNGTNDPRTLLPQGGVDESPAPPGPNVLSNVGFDRDLSGWTIATETYPTSLTDAASAAWTSADASGVVTSGGLALHAAVGYHQSAQRSLSQCVAVPDGNRLVSFGTKVRTAEQFGEAGVAVDLTTFASDDCSGNALGTNTATSLGLTGYPYLSSNDAWLRAPMMVVAPAAARSARLSVRVFAVGNGYYWYGWVDAVADDVYLSFAPATFVTTILPSAAHVRGAQGSLWTTVASLVNTGASDASVTLKFLGHDADGRGGPEFSYLAPAGGTLPDVNGGFLDPFAGTFGAVLVTSSSPSVFLQSATSSWIQGIGSVGQALPAFGPADYAGAVPKTLAPIRENASFRTNLVLANPTEIPVTAHVALFAADGTAIGSQDVDLPPFGMTQINRVASALGATTLDAGRISVSTSTPGGLVAAYASVIDNVTNDPRTLLPR